MKSIKEIVGQKRYSVLGGKTLAECAEMYKGKRTALLDENGYRRSDDTEGAESIRKHLEHSAVPERIVEILAAGAKETPGVVAVRDWFGSGKNILVLHGEPDAGKSVSAASAFLFAKERLCYVGGEALRWQLCVFEHASEAARQQLFGEEASRYWEFLTRTAKVLVLDDLGAEMTTEAWQSVLDNLLNARYADPKLRTVLTTNVSCRRPSADKPSPFEARYGARIARRVREAGAVVAVGKLGATVEAA